MAEEQCPVWEYLDAGEALVTAAEWPEAIVLYQEGLKHYPDCPELHRALGVVQEQIGDSLGQRSSYQRAIELEPEQPVWVYMTLAYLLKQQGAFAEAIEVYQRVCSLNFLGSLDSPSPLNPAMLGDFEESEERRDLGFEVGRHLGECWTELGEIAEAIAAYERALQLEPERLWVKHRMGVLRFRWGLQLLEAGQVAEAIGQFEQIDQVQDYQGSQLPWFEEMGMRWPWMRPDWMQQFELEKPEGQEWPCITVVTPSLNQGDYLEETILSVLNQQYPNLDYVIVDGGSRDQTPEILQRYRDRVAAVIVESDGGQSEAINKGMGQARGELLLWVNSDDLLAPGALHVMALTYLQQGSEVIAGICLVHEQGRVVGMRRPRVRQADFTVAHLADVARLWSTGHFFFQPEVVFSRSLWERVGGRLDESLHYAMDHDLWMRFAVAGARLTVVGFPFAMFRQHELQKTANRMASMQELVQVTERYHQVLVRQARQEEIGQRIRRLLQMKQPRLLVVCGQADQRFDPDYRDFTWQNGHQQYHIQVCATLANIEVALFDAILLLVNEDESTLFKHLGRLKYNGLSVAWYEQIHFNDGFSLQLAAAVDICIPMQIGMQKILKNTESVVLDCVVPGITEWTAEAATERLQQQEWAESAQLPIVSCVRDSFAIETAFTAALTQFDQDGFAGRFRRHRLVVSQHLWTHRLEQIVQQLWDWVEALEAANGVRGMVMKMQRSVWDYLDAGKELVETAKWTEAIALYQEAIGQYPERAELYRALGFAQEKVGDGDGQRLSYQRAIELEPEQPKWVYGTLGHLLTEQQQWQQAIDVYRLGLEHYPEQASFYRDLGLVQEHLGEVVAEIASYRRAIELEPQPAWVYETLLELLVRQGDGAGAIAVGQLGLAQYPEQVALQQRVAELLREGQASQNGSAVSEERPEPKALVSLEAYVERAKQLTEQERFQEAIGVYQEAIGQYPEQAALYREVGILQEKVGDIEGEIRSYGKAVDLEKQPAWVYATLGSLLMKQGKDLSGAISAYHKALELNVDSPEGIYENLARTFCKAKRLPEAISAYRKALELNPQNAYIYNELGDVYQTLSDFDSAVVAYRSALELKPDLRGIREQLNQALAQLSIRKEQARSKVSNWPFEVESRQVPPTLPDGQAWPKISIVTPSLNQGKFIEETILSVIHQNYPNVEYILVDGGSTDNTMQVVEKYRQHFSYVASEPDRGQGHAINKGFQQATGEILTWLNSDDRLAPGALYAVALAFYTSRADVIAGVCQLFRDGIEVEQHLTSCPNGLLPLSDLLDLENCWLRGKFFYQPEVMFTRRIWEQSGGAVDESLFYSMDYELWVRFATQKATLQVIGCPVAQYRMHPEQKTSTVDQYEPELRQVREALSRRYNCPIPQSADVKAMKRHLRIAMVNDVGHLGGAGIAHTRIGQALALAGHEVISIAGALDWALTPVDCTAEEVYQKVAEVNPDLVVVGNLHGMKYPIEILDRLTEHFHTIFVMHDQWLLTGRCAYTGNCEKYMMHCDAECPTSHEYPRLEPESIADAFTQKYNLIRNKERLLVVGVSNWLTNWAKHVLMHHGSPQGPVEVNRKFQSIYCGLDLAVFCPHDKLESRRQLELPEDKFIILTGSDSVEERRKGLQDLTIALKIASLDGVMVVSFGSGNLSNFFVDGVEVRHLGYIAQPILANFYNAADLFICPSQEEAFGQTFVEASACGTLSVGYGIGGVKEAIKDDISGRVVAVKTPESLAEVIKQLYSNLDRRNLLNATSSIYAANNFSLRSSYHHFISALQESDWLERLSLQPIARFSTLTSKPSQRKVIKVQSVSKNYLSLYDKGNNLLLQGDYEAASVAYREATELNPKDAQSYCKLGKVLFYLEDWQNSVNVLRQAIELKSDFAEAYCYLGDTLLAQQDWDGAVEAYTKAIEHNSNTLEESIYERLGEALNQCQLQKQEYTRLLEIEQELLAKHPLPYKIFLPTEKMPIERRVEGLRRVIDIYENRWQQYYQPKLLELRAKYKNHKRAFIIGNGPSINLTDLDLLKDEITFGVNGIFLKSRDTGFIPTFYVVEDHLVAEDRQEAIANFQGPIKLFPISLAYCIEEKSDTLFFDHRPRKSYPEGFDFSTDASVCTYTGCTVTFTCMQLAYFLGVKEIYLIGVDCDYSIPEDVKVDQEYAVGTLDMDSDDKNHFHPDYFGKGYRWHDPQVHKMKEAYQEARRVCNETGIDMYNATIGGKLEVFPRVDYYSLFNINEAYPRVLIIDMTRMGSVSATGQIKKTLFSLWPKANLLQVYTIGSEGIGLFSEADLYLNQEQPLDELSILNECRRFNPALIYYRPLSDKPYFYNFAIYLMEELKVPVVTHVMDDWMDRLSHKNPVLYGEFDTSLRALLAQSSLRLSICESMSLAFQERYDMDFIPFANCVEPEDWNRGELSEIERGDSIETQFTIRYIGGLADDMNFDSICDIVKVVASLHEEIKVCFEIYTPSHWMEKALSEFSTSPGVAVCEANFSSEGYRNLLCSANALVIAYNFDEISLRYTRYSMANKLPECLASAIPVLVYGPEAVATVEYAIQTGTVLSVTERNCQMLEKAIRNLIQNYKDYQELAWRAQKIAFEYHNAHQKRLQFSNMLRHSVTFGQTVSKLPILTLSLDLVGKFARDKHAYINEAQLVTRVGSLCQEVALINISSSSDSSLNELGESDGDDRQQCSIFHVSPESIKQALVHHQEILQKYSILVVYDSAELQKVLEAVYREKFLPDIIQCGFSQGVKGSSQCNCDELAESLLARNYTVLVSEWHPRIPFRMRQDWCRLTRYPCTVHEDSWGYLIAFKQKPDFSKIVMVGRKITEITSSNAANAKLHLESGKSYMKKGEISKAVDEFQLSIEMAPERYDAYFQMAELLFKQKRFDEAITYYCNVVELNSHHHWSWRGLADIYMLKNDLDQAITCYKQAATISPQYFFAWQGLGRAFEAKKLFVDAVAAYRKALEIHASSNSIQKSLDRWLTE